MVCWMDMTNSLVTWQGGAVGIIRVELETACTMKKQNPDLRICVYRDGDFADVTDELDWLFGAENPLDAYLEHFGRGQSVQKKAPEEKCPEFEAAMSVSESRSARLKQAVKLTMSGWSPRFQLWLMRILRPLFHLLMGFRTRRLARRAAAVGTGAPKPDTALTRNVRHPFSGGDSVFCCGWYLSGKEAAYSAVKRSVPDLRLNFLVYDLVLVKPETACFYTEKEGFTDYLHWVANNCDHVFYWGKTAQDDAEALYREKHWRVPPGSPAFCCSTMKRSSEAGSEEIEALMTKLGVTGPYALMVGSIEPKKNYDVIYAAYCIMARLYPAEEIPQCVIIGSNFGSCKDLVRCIQNDARTKDRFIFTRASDEELAILYDNALFTMVPSFYEGWSIVVAEMLSYGKLCLAADTPPLREVGEDMAVYIDPLDARAWAETIHRFRAQPEDIRVYEERIRQKWQAPGWNDMAAQILQELRSPAVVKSAVNEGPKVYYDFTIGYAYAFSDTPALTGIPRAILMMARNLHALIPNLKYFALTDMGYIEIDDSDIRHIIEGSLLDDDFRLDSLTLRAKALTIPAVTTGGAQNKKGGLSDKAKAKWLFASVLPQRMQKKAIARLKKAGYVEPEGEAVMYTENRTVDLPFQKDDIVLTLGPGWPAWIERCMAEEKEKKGFCVIQTIYDMTPVIIPHTHTSETLHVFTEQFLPNMYGTSDYILYGGETAKRDGEAYARGQGMTPPKGYALKWGNDLKVDRELSETRKREILDHYGIQKPFILTVGTVQRRKNQEILYRAMLRLMQEGKDKDLQLIIAGYPGWGYDDFLKNLRNDERCRGRVLVLTPSDEELNLLYRECLFTVLPSLYEGWSLTLPEGLEYGKFCIAADSDPLREIGGELIDYVDPYDAAAWAEAIDFYVSHPEALREREKKIADGWHGISWMDCSQQLAGVLGEIVSERGGKRAEREEQRD